MSIGKPIIEYGCNKSLVHEHNTVLSKPICYPTYVGCKDNGIQTYTPMHRVYVNLLTYNGYTRRLALFFQDWNVTKHDLPWGPFY